MPGFDADEAGAGFGPDAQIRHAGIRNFEPRAPLRAIANPAAGHPVEYDRVRGKQGVVQLQLPVFYGSFKVSHHEQPLGIQTANGARLLPFKSEEVG